MFKQLLSNQCQLVKRELGSSDFDSKFFFNSFEFITGRDKPGRSIVFEIENNGLTLARMCITVIDGKALSPWKAPFGSIECFGRVDFSVLDSFVSEVLTSLSSDGLKSLEVIHYPEFYDAQNSLGIHESFLSNDFKINTAETNQHIEVNHESLKSKINYSQRKRLNKCIRAGFSQSVDKLESLKEAYELLSDSRRRKGYPITMTYSELNRMFELHPEQYFLFAIRDQEKMIAMAISIRVSQNILYNFYHADHRDYTMYSPTVMLVNSVYEYCQKEEIDRMDLGISSVDGVLNEGLYNFKKGLGAIEAKKMKYTWNNQWL